MEAEFLAPPRRLVTDKDRRHHHAQRRLRIAERLIQKWRKSFSGDVQNKEEFYTMKREERRVGHRRRQEFVELELENPNLTADFDSDDPM
jgi:hypothetical protein